MRSYKKYFRKSSFLKTLTKKLTIMKPTENNKIDLRHNDLREILMKYNCPEYGDCIIDEICHLFDYPLTNDEN